MSAALDLDTAFESGMAGSRTPPDAILGSLPQWYKKKTTNPLSCSLHAVIQSRSATLLVFVLHFTVLFILFIQAVPAKKTSPTLPGLTAVCEEHSKEGKDLLLVQVSRKQVACINAGVEGGGGSRLGANWVREWSGFGSSGSRQILSATLDSVLWHGYTSS